jgi:hypothetical protein
MVLGVIGFGWASASPHPSAGKKLEAIEPFEFATETDTDLGDPGLSQGDLSTFHFDVYDSTGTTQLGYETSQCVVGSVNDGIFTFDCSSDFVLTDGQIETEGTLEGTVGLGPRALIARGQQAELAEHFAITGGTGRYRGSRGQLDWGGDDPDAIILSFNLIG